MAGLFHYKRIKRAGLDGKNYSKASILFGYLILLSTLSLSIFLIAEVPIMNTYNYFMIGHPTIDITDHNTALYRSFMLAGIYCFLMFFSGCIQQLGKGNLFNVFVHFGFFYGIVAGWIIQIGFSLGLFYLYYDSHGYTLNLFYNLHWQILKPCLAISAFVIFLCLIHRMFPRFLEPKNSHSKPFETKGQEGGELGNAKLAEKEYLISKGLIAKRKEALKGIGHAIGKIDDEYIVLHENTHSLTIAPPRSGKAVSKAMLCIMDSQDPIFALDMKCELFLTTYRDILNKGRHPIVLDPVGTINQYGDFREYITSHMNPLQTKFQLNGLAREKYLDNLVKSLTIDIEQHAKESHFIDMAKPLLKAMLDQFLNKGKTLLDMYDHFMMVGDKELLKRVTALLKDNPQSRLLRNAISTFQETDSRELSGIMTTLKRCLHFLNSETWAYFFSKDGFDFYDYAVEGQDLFICIDQSTVENNPKVIRMIFSLLKSTYEILPPDILAYKKYPVILDEVAQLGSLEEIEKIYEIFGDKGVRMNLFFQNMDQIETFKKSNMLKSIELKQIFSVRDPKTIKWIQDLSGKQTITLVNKNENNSLSKGKNTTSFFTDNTNRSSGEGISESKTGTELLHTAMLRELESHEQLVFFRNVRPFICDRIFYYDDQRYQGRFSINYACDLFRHLIDREAAKRAQDAFMYDYENNKPVIKESIDFFLNNDENKENNSKIEDDENTEESELILANQLKD